MKKTIFSLFAVAGLAVSAQGATVMTWDSATLAAANGKVEISTETITTSGYGNFSVTVVVDAEAFQTLVKNKDYTTFGTAMIFASSAVQSESLGVCYNGSSSSNMSGLWGAHGNATALTTKNGDFGDAMGDNLKSTFESTTFESIAFTMTVDGSGLQCYLTMVEADGTLTEISSGKISSYRFSNFGQLGSISYNTEYVKYMTLTDTYLDTMSEASVANKEALALASIPEPATASLSLLGLAALMMRRRRA